MSASPSQCPFEDHANIVLFSLRCVRWLAAAATPADPSRIIMVSSTGGTTVPHIGENGAIAYAISKASVHHLSRNLALELAPQHITTNTIAPGWFPTRLALPAIEKAGGVGEAGKDNPLGRLGIREDMAGVAIYLASKAGAYVNGEDIAVCGGANLGSATKRRDVAKL
jgi:NAD(P)-dependent dehydrogenase (short-subunit alcohol dehydrogenase family)